MRKILLLLTVVLVVFIVVNRQRLYLRDPLGKVYRGTVQQDGARVFINYSNDVLVQAGDGAQIEEYIVQAWNKLPGTPTVLKCMQGMVCMAGADHATIEPSHGAAHVEMTDRQVSFVDGDGIPVKITLR